MNVLKSVNKLYFGQKNKKVGKFSLFCLLKKNFNVLQNLGKCYSQFVLTFYLYSCLFPDLKGFQWQKKSNATFLGRRKYLLRRKDSPICDVCERETA